MDEYLKYTLSYREKGENKEHILEFDFISNYLARKSGEFLIRMYEFLELHDKYNSILLKLGKIKYDIDVEEEKEAKIKLKDEREGLIVNKKEAEKKLLLFKETDSFDRKVEMIVYALKDNGYPEESKFLDSKFWDKCVEPKQLLNIINAIASDGAPKKKIAVSE